MRPPPLLSEGVRATEALAALKRSGLPLAPVVDERGDIEGLVTPTGDLEESSQAPIVRRADRSWLVDGPMNAEELKARIEVSRRSDEQEEGW